MKLSSPYESPLRTEQKKATRQRIIEAAGRLLEDRGLQEFSFARIANEAGVKERTVYRHFPTKGDLIRSLCEWFLERVHYGSFAQTETELLAKPQQVFPGFEENEQLARALWSSPQGREFRLSNVEERKAGIKAAIADATRELPRKQAKWVAAAMHVLLSSAAWQAMKDYYGLSGEEAGKASAFAMESVLIAVRQGLAPVSKYK